MKKELFQKKFIHSLGYELTKNQEVTADLLADFFTSNVSNHVFLLKGYAGTGKTTVIAATVKSLLANGIKVVLLAPTGRAAKVISAYSGYPAFTIHKWIYRKQSQKEGVSRFVLDKNKSNNTVFIVDEASMLNNFSVESSTFGSGRLLDDLIQFVDDGLDCRLMLVGDEAQLPPVRLDMSPALNTHELKSYGLDVTDITLTQVVRQATDSGILSNATSLRKMISENNIEIPKFQTIGFDDIIRLSGVDLVEALESSYSKVGIDQTIVVSYSNKRANKYNQGIRNSILWREEELSQGDLLMVVRNNYHWVEDIPEINFIANGDVVEVIRIHKIKELHGFRFAEVTIRMLDYQQQEFDVTLMLDTLTVDGPTLPAESQKALYDSVSQDYAHIQNNRNRLKKIKGDPFNNALQIKFAYAVTCHKAQGGQWRHVYIDQGFFRDEMISREYLRWLYTALTRATEKVYLVNFAKSFFNSEDNFF
ncbi:MAG: ATP-dependent RecD-like DNA helicase [Bacteroidales bacterium]